ncbi:restriction endonuclease subunit S domain-containing protein [Acuticoccus mangrovi]|uniref:Type I restriction modification DNA specificity domain-containing protein n=1 Tax=Acuticoccus mangrovi TaxID=2796142 RepID=A0A934MFM8_9HYPH|nr:hypothetical protein [Acuticoccus mangrovi]MBJ3778827.1 hypothetical protein [Acuticoccus mangrovi]
MEAENYLASGYGTRISIEAKERGWARLHTVANISQPSRLKGTVVSQEFGKPYLSATQIFDVRPFSRRFLSLGKIKVPKALEVDGGEILVTRSGSVGRATLAHSVHVGHIISDDLLRIDAIDPDWWGWIYAYLRAPTVREMMKAAQYGHIIKHLETHHLDELPIITPSVPRIITECQAATEKILDSRNQAFLKINEAEALFEKQFPTSETAADASAFIRRASEALFRNRRRFDAWSHNPEKEEIERRLNASCKGWTTLEEAGCEVWLPNRFKRIPAEDGVELIDSSQIFELNPDYNRRISAAGIADKNNGRVEPGWIMMSRSGQVYGLLGSVAMATEQHAGKVVSDDVIRIAPSEDLRPGYLYVAISHSSLGRPRAKALAYGSSIPHVEVEDLKGFSIPRLTPEIEKQISDLAEEAFKLWSEADERENAIADTAEAEITDFLSRKTASK